MSTLKLVVYAGLASVALGAEFRFSFQRDLFETSNSSLEAIVGEPTKQVNAAAVNGWYANTGELLRFHRSLISSIPNRYSIRYRYYDRIYGYISDGGYDMYDGGNQIGTSMCNGRRIASWVDNFAVSRMSRYSSTCFGTRGTRTARFNIESSGTMLAAINTAGRPYDLRIFGNNGADGGGNRQVDTYRRNGLVIFRKTVCGTNDPSINHLIMTVDHPSLRQQVASSTDSDNHFIQNIQPNAPYYFVMVAGQRSRCYDNSVWSRVTNLMFEHGDGWTVDVSAIKPGTQVAIQPTANAGYSTPSLFLAANQLVQYPAMPAFGSSYTLCAYANIKTSEGTLFDFQTSSFDSIKVEVAGRKIKAYTRSSNSISSRDFLSNNPANNGWRTICVVKSGNTVNIYDNGNVRGTGNLPSPSSGPRAFASTGAGNLGVAIADVYINTNSALSGSQISNMNCNGNGQFAQNECTCADSAGSRCQYSNAIICNDAGSATDSGACICGVSHYGESCQQCAPGYQGAECEHSNRFTCSDNGVAQPDGSCVCFDGFLGASCEHHDGHSCNGHGSVAADGSCTCDSGYAGSDCGCDGSCLTCIGPAPTHCTACPGDNRLASPFVTGVSATTATGTTYGVCVSPCTSGQYIMDSGLCADWTQCPEGFVEAADGAPSATQDRVCVEVETPCQPCIGNTYQDAGCNAENNEQTSCAACTPCAENEYAVEPCTATSNRICVVKSTIGELPSDTEATVTSVDGSVVLIPSDTGAGVFVGGPDELNEKLMDMTTALAEKDRMIMELMTIVDEHHGDR